MEMMSLGEERGVFMATNMFAFDPLQSQANMGLPPLPPPPPPSPPPPPPPLPPALHLDSIRHAQVEGSWEAASEKMRKWSANGEQTRKWKGNGEIMGK